MSPHWPRKFPPEVPVGLLKQLKDAPPDTPLLEGATTYRRSESGSITAVDDSHVARYTPDGKRVG